MNSIMFYSEESDKEIYESVSIELRQVRVKITAATIAGSTEKSNEDTFALASNEKVLFGAVFDGTTSLKPIKMLGNQSGARFASHFLKENLCQIDSSASPKKAMVQLNKDLLKANLALGGTLDDTHSLPASLATIIKFDSQSDTATFAHVGDAFGVVFYKDGLSEIFTEDTNKKFDDSMFSLLSKIAVTEGLTPRIARDDERIKAALVEMFIVRNNNPNGKGSGLINGDPNFEQYIQSGKIKLTGVTDILLASDGLLPPGWSLNAEKDRQKILKVIKEGGFEQLFKLKHEEEDNDPDWNNIRYKHSDDATGLLFHFDTI